MEACHEEIHNGFFPLASLLFSSVPRIAAASNKELEEKMVSLEKQGWEAIKKKDWNVLSSLMTEDFCRGR